MKAASFPDGPSATSQPSPSGGRDRDKRRGSSRVGGWKFMCCALAAWLPGALVFFWPFVHSGFDKVQGDIGDGRLIVYLHEHLYRVVQGLSPLTSPAMFYPQHGVLGYSDAFLLNVLIYAPFRMMGIDPYLSYQIVWVTLTLIGFLSFAVLLIRYTGVRTSVALAGGALFAFPNMLMAVAGHPQLFDGNLAPVILLLLLEALSGTGRLGFRGYLLMLLCGMLDALTFATAYYTAWFFNFLVVLVVLVMIATRPSVVYWLTGHRSTADLLKLLSVGLCGFFVGIIPFVWIYFPVLLEFHGTPRSFAEYLSWAPTLPEMLVNVGAKNMVWGKLLKATGIISPAHMHLGEYTFAVTPCVFISAMIVCLAAWRRRVLTESYEAALRTVVLASVPAVLLMFIIVSKFYHWSPFWIIIHTVPGASAIHVGARCGVIGSGFLVAAAAIGFDRGLRSPSLSWRLLVCSAIIICLLEQVNFDRLVTVSRSRESRWLAATPPPPESCRCFYIAPQEGRPIYAQQIDAMMISQKFGVPTLNGYSGNIPVGWLLWDISSPVYPLLAKEWAGIHSLTNGLFEYSVAKRQWLPETATQCYSLKPEPLGSLYRLGLNGRCEGSVESVRWMRGGGKAILFISGWAADRESGESMHGVVAAVDGRVASLCLVGVPLPDVASTPPSKIAADCGWVGYIRARRPINRVEIFGIPYGAVKQLYPLASVSVPPP